MTYLVFILPVLVIIGAFMWLKPSPRDQRLAQLRSNALISGFRITSLKVNDNSEQGRVNQTQQIVTLYEVSLVPSKESLSEFIVQRTSGESGAYLPSGWAWEARSELSAEHYQALADLLASLPEAINLLALNRSAVGLCWDEMDEAVAYDQLKQPLLACAQIFARQLVR